MTKQNLWVLVQARMSSTRLPGKSLLPFHDTTLLGYQIQQLERVVPRDQIYVLTSIEPSDDILASFCEEHAINVFRGSLTNVAERFVDVLKSQSNINVFARFCADRPLYDIQLLEDAYDVFQEKGSDLVTNVFPSTYPKGQTTEIVRSETYLRAYPLFSHPDHFEHVTKFFYEHHEDYKIENIEASDSSFNEINMCVDTEVDYERCLEVIKRQPDARSWQTDAELLRTLPCVE